MSEMLHEKGAKERKQHMKIQSEKRGMTLSYSLVQGFFWMSFAAVVGFSSVYLLDCGLTSSQVGLILAVSGIVAAVTQPMVAGYADQPAALSLKWIVLIVCGLAFLSSLLLLVVYRKSVLLTGLFYGSCSAFLQFLMPFINSLGTEMISRGVGRMAVTAGVIAVPAGIMVGYGLLFVCVLAYPFCRRETEEGKEGIPQTDTPKALSPAAFLKKYPRFAFVLGGTVLLYISHVLLNNFLYQIIQAKGGGSQETGFVMSFCACVELLPMFLFSYMLKKAGSDVWYRLCGVFMAGKAIASLLAPSLPVFYVVQILQLAGWGLIAIAPIYYVNSVISAEDAIKGQAYVGMSYTVANVAASLAGGWMIDLAGVRAMLAVASLAGAAGAAVVIWFTERMES